MFLNTVLLGRFFEVKESALECLGHLVACTGDSKQYLRVVDQVLASYPKCVTLLFAGPSRLSAHDSRLPPFFCGAHQERGNSRVMKSGNWAKFDWIYYELDPESPWHSYLECHGRKMTKLRIMEECMASCFVSMTCCFGVRGFKPLKPLKVSQRVSCRWHVRQQSKRWGQSACPRRRAVDNLHSFSCWTYLDISRLFEPRVSSRSCTKKWKTSAWIELRKICIKGYWRPFALMTFEGSDNCNQLYSSSGSLLRSDKSQKYFPVLLEWQNDLCMGLRWGVACRNTWARTVVHLGRARRLWQYCSFHCASKPSPPALFGKHILDNRMFEEVLALWEWNIQQLFFAYAGCT